MKKLLLFLLVCYALSSQAQTTGDYRSASTGFWNLIATWERYDGTAWQPAATVPAETDGTVTIRSPHTVTISSGATADQIVINAGGTLSDNALLILVNGPGADLICNGTFLLSNILNGAGSVEINSIMSWTAGTIGTPLTITTSGIITMSTTNPKTLNNTITNAGTITWSSGIFNLNNIFTNTGTFNWSGGDFSFNDGTMRNSGTLNNSSDGNINNTSGTNTFINSGTLSKTDGTGSTLLEVAFTNSGTLAVNSGTITNGNSFVNTGTINLPSGTTFVNSSTLTLNQGTVINGTGTLTLDNTEYFNISLSFPPEFLLNKTSGSTNGSGVTTVNGTMSWTGGILNSPFEIPATGILNMSAVNTKLLSSSLNNAGVINWSNGIFDFSDGTFSNLGTVNNSFDGVMNNSNGINLFTNSGTFSKTVGTGTTSIIVNTQNTGILKGIGTIDFGTTFTNNGTIAPGLSPGVITVTSSSPVFTANSSLQMELLDGLGPGTGHDQLITGSATLDGNLSLTELGTIQAGTYTIISSTGTLTGTFSSVTQPGGYTVIYNSNSVVVTKSAILPVNLVLFTATSQATGIELKWQTATEQNTKRYIVERSADGVAFVEIGTVSAIGNSSTARSYSFTDRQPVQNVSYYRLKSLDNDGIFVYSKIAEVSNKAAVALLSIYPNPVADGLRITGLKQGVHHTIQLIDANGRIVLQTKTANAQLAIDMSTRKHGSYWVKIITAEEAVIHKILKPQ